MKLSRLTVAIIVAIVGAAAFSTSVLSKKVERQQVDATMSLQQAVSVMAKELSREIPWNDKVAVVDFQMLDGTRKPLCSYWSEGLTGEIHKQGRLKVMERRMIRKLLEEQELQASDMTRPEIITKTGKLLGVKWIITGTITRIGDEVEINARAMKVKRGKVGAQSKVRIFENEVANLLEEEKEEPEEQPEQAKPQQTQQPVQVALSAAPQIPVPSPGSGELKVTASFLAAASGTGTRDLIVGPDQSRERLTSIQPGTVLHSGDKIKVVFSSSRDCYVYIFQFGSTGVASVLFPNQQIAMSNYVTGGVTHAIPPGTQWYFLDQNTGKEEICLVASTKPINNIEQMMTRLIDAPQQKQEQYSQMLAGELDSFFATRGAGEAQPPIDSTGTAASTFGERNIGGVTEGPSIPLNLSGQQQAQAQSFTIEAKKGVVARHIQFEHR